MNRTIWQYAYWRHFPYNLPVESDSWFTQDGHLEKVNQAGGLGRSNTGYWYTSILESATAQTQLLLASPRASCRVVPWTVWYGVYKTYLSLCLNAEQTIIWRLTSRVLLSAPLDPGDQK